MKLAFSALAGAGQSARLSTLIFHRVTPTVDELFPGEVDARRFDAICGWLRRWFNVLPLDEAVRRLRDGSLPPRPLCITFDDGYADNHDVALPILQRHGLTATFFIATGYLDGGLMWNDVLVEVVRAAKGDQLDLGALKIAVGRQGLLDLSSLGARRESASQLLRALKYLPPADRSRLVDEVADAAGMTLPRDLMMTADKVVALHRGGMGVGAHTVTHPIMARIDESQAIAEIRDSRRRLEEIVRAPVSLFAYPNGKPVEDYTPRDVALVREAGFAAAFTTAPGVASSGHSLLELPRFTPWRQGKWSFAAQLARNMAGV